MQPQHQASPVAALLNNGAAHSGHVSQMYQQQQHNQQQHQQQQRHFPPLSVETPTGRFIRPRKSHVKSRKGCGNCKRRRIKCDEEKPQCFNCIKHGVNCDYLQFSEPASSVPDESNRQRQRTSEPGSGSPGSTTPESPASVYASSQTSASKLLSSQATSRSAVEQQNNLADAEFSKLHMAQLELLHHFLTVTAPTFTDKTDGDLWLIQIPRMAFGHEFLMYAILTIASTHMRFLQERAREQTTLELVPADLAAEKERNLYFERAEIWYRQRALETFRKAIMGPRGPGNLEAMTVAGSLIAIQSFAFKERDESGNLKEPRSDQLVEIEDASDFVIISIDRWLPILLGIRTVVHEMQTMQTGFDLDSLFGIDFGSLANSSPGGTQDQPALAQLLAFTTKLYAGNQAELECYIPAIHLLAQLVTAFRHSRPAELRKYVFTWPFLLSEEFHLRLRGRETIALIIFVHFLAVVSLLGAWWQEERVHADVVAICRLYLAGEEWRPWLQWVFDVVPFSVFP